MRKRARVLTTIKGKSLTQQHMAADANINNVMSKHLKNARPGVPIGTNAINPREPRFLDISSMDYQTMLDRVCAADSQFESLPSRIRGRFRDVGQMLRFVENPANRAQCIKWGIIDPTDEEIEAKADAEAKAAAEAAGQQNFLRPDPEAQPGFRTGGNVPTSGTGNPPKNA